MRTETAQGRIRAADAYLAARTGNYAMRCERYDAARFGLWDFQEVREASFYGKPADSLFAVWTPPR